MERDKKREIEGGRGRERGEKKKDQLTKHVIYVPMYLYLLNYSSTQKYLEPSLLHFTVNFETQIQSEIDNINKTFSIPNTLVLSFVKTPTLPNIPYTTHLTPPSPSSSYSPITYLPLPPIQFCSSVQS